jgi:hypothetical protein
VIRGTPPQTVLSSRENNVLCGAGLLVAGTHPREAARPVFHSAPPARERGIVLPRTLVRLWLFSGGDSELPVSGALLFLLVAIAVAATIYGTIRWLQMGRR